MIKSYGYVMAIKAGEEKRMGRFKCISAMDFVKDWNSWRSTPKERTQQARKVGVSDETIQNLALKMGNFLAQKASRPPKKRS
jgi:hypothetical protein